MNKIDKFPLKRRHESKTDYDQRLNILKSDKPRFVVRKSEKHFQVQVSQYSEEGDLVVTSSHSNQLKEFGWKYSTQNTPAAYLTGYLCGFRAIEKDIEAAVPDIGLNPISAGSTVFAVIKGAIDAGLDVPAGESVLPPSERIRGQHIAEYADQSEGSEDTEDTATVSSDKIPEHFEQVKNNIKEYFGV